jgi:RNA polymerase sigma-70 factor (ECF subfamily)
MTTFARLVAALAKRWRGLTSGQPRVNLRAHQRLFPNGGAVLPSSSTQVTQLLARWSAGDAHAREVLIPLVYDELRRLARYSLARQRPDHTLQSTALVHEAYMRLVGRPSVHFENRAHFFAVASQLMRRILVDHARKHNAAKRGGNNLTLVLDNAVELPAKREFDLTILDEALNALAALDARQANIVEMRFFGGLSIDETSHVLGISPATVKREWTTARTWLYDQMTREAS